VFRTILQEHREHSPSAGTELLPPPRPLPTFLTMINCAADPADFQKPHRISGINFQFSSCFQNVRLKIVPGKKKPFRVFLSSNHVYFTGFYSFDLVSSLVALPNKRFRIILRESISKHNSSAVRKVRPHSRPLRLPREDKI
jgi:hypothetical protein